MIEINLTPGASRKSKGRGASFSLKSVIGGDRQSSVKDPFLLAAIASLIVATGTVGMMHLTQTSTATDLAAREVQAVADSTRFATVLRQRRSAEAKRDSVLKQLTIIKAIDADRFIWPHVMLKFRLVGNTVDIQALTRFMKLLEASPFIQNVTLAGSQIAMLDGKEVTEFTLDAMFERPDSSMITLTPVSLSVR
jgi:hypothetical protein